MTPTPGAGSTPRGALRGAVLLLVALAASCGPSEASRDQDEFPGPPFGDLERLETILPACEEAGLPTWGNLEPDTIAGGLEVPWDLAFLPDGRVLLTERTGRIRLIDENGLRDEPWATLDVRAEAEAGLLGIDLAPDFRESGHVFVMKTYLDLPASRMGRIWAALRRRLDRGTPSDEDAVWKNRVVRFTDGGTVGADRTVVLDDIPSGALHAGGALRFGPDGFLYLGVGDGAEPNSAPDPGTLRGKMLRVDRTGSPPPTNPTPSSPVFARGLRNPQGMGWDPITGDHYAIDHGPTGLEREGYRRDKDELNLIVSGGHYGWPHVAGRWTGGGFETPVVEWTPAIAPAGLTFVDAPGHPWHGEVLVTGLVTREIRRVVLDRHDATRPPHEAAVCQEALFAGQFGRLRAIRAAPDGSVYFGTSNRDQRGRPGPGDDFLMRIRPSDH